MPKDELKIKACLSRKSDHWETPKEFLQNLESEFGKFDLDPCPLYGSGGLDIPWNGNVFVNPPYSDIYSWVKKAHQEIIKNASVIVMLIPARTDTKWFHEYIYNHAEIRFLKGRLKFSNSKNSAPFPSMLVIWNRRPADAEIHPS